MDNIAAAFFVPDDVADVRSIQAALSMDCADKLRDVFNEIESFDHSKIAWVTSSKVRLLGDISADATTLAAKLDQYPTFSWKPKILKAVGGFIVGEPSSGDFRKLKIKVQVALLSLLDD